MAKTQIIDTDKGLKRIKEIAKELSKKPHVIVGIYGEKALEDKPNEDGSRSGVTNVEIATFHEFGAPGAGIPERSFIRGTVDRHNGYRNSKMLLMAELMNPKSKMKVLEALTLLGRRVKSDIIKTVTNSIGLKPLLKSTIKQKTRKYKIGGKTAVANRPLIDSGQMVGSIEFQVNESETP